LSAVRLKLHRHADTPCAALTGIEVEIVRTAQAALELHFFVSGAIREISWPLLAAPERRDRLWEHSCFELFVAAEGRATYFEINLSPSTRWAAYRFSDYRSGMQIARSAVQPEIESRITAKTYVLFAKVSLAAMPGLPENAIWRVGLSAVIEPKTGGKSYWALAHPHGKPDFHHKDCFALQLPPPGQS
jgi:hypothetical protein